MRRTEQLKSDFKRSYCSTEREGSSKQIKIGKDSTAIKNYNKQHLVNRQDQLTFTK